MLEYIAQNPEVEVVFLLVICVMFLGVLTSRRLSRYAQMKHEEDQAARRERLVIIESKKPEPTKVPTVVEY